VSTSSSSTSPGSRGTSHLDPDLRADFLNGATGSLAFGFALNSGVESDDYFASLSVFDAAGNLLGSESVARVFGGSDFPDDVGNGNEIESGRASVGPRPFGHC